MSRINKIEALDLKRELEILRAFQAQNAGKIVGVIYGPKSKEDTYYIERVPREHLGISHILSALERLGFNVKEIDPTKEGFDDAIQGVDFCFLNMHGEYGEDGRLQGFLDYLGKPYIGSGVQASALGLNKVLCKHLMRGLNLPTPRFIVPGLDTLETALALGFPLIAKKVLGGSSIGTRLLHSQEEWDAFLSSELASDDYFIEEFIEGRPLTVGILEFEYSLVTTPILETIYDKPFYDEDIKRGEGEIRYELPAKLEPETTASVQEAALQLHRNIGCCGFSRVDFILDSRGPHILEINTIPGMSGNSNFAVSTKALGLSYDETVLTMLLSCLRPK